MKSVLVIAGLDPGGGAGLIADVRVCAEHQIRPVGVVTALTEQDTRGVRAVHPVDSEIVAAQLTALLSDIEIDAVKIGMLATEPIAAAVAAALDLTAAPVVWDPVIAPTSGCAALWAGDVGGASRLLARHIGIVTPNIDEATALSGEAIADQAGMRRAARALCDRGFAAALVTGGHLAGERVVDVFASAGEIRAYEHERLAAHEPVHGTGCALSTALACQLARGCALPEAVAAAQRYVIGKLGRLVRPGRGLPAVL